MESGVMAKKLSPSLETRAMTTAQFATPVHSICRPSPSRSRPINWASRSLLALSSSPFATICHPPAPASLACFAPPTLFLRCRPSRPRWPSCMRHGSTDRICRTSPLEIIFTCSETSLLRVHDDASGAR